jgi:hypothetical protein
MEKKHPLVYVIAKGEQQNDQDQSNRGIKMWLRGSIHKPDVKSKE